MTDNNVESFNVNLRFDDQSMGRDTRLHIALQFRDLIPFLLFLRWCCYSLH